MVRGGKVFIAADLVSAQEKEGDVELPMCVVPTDKMCCRRLDVTPL